MAKKEKVEEKKKALFTQRLFAFLIDVIIVMIITSIISVPFIDADKNKEVAEETNAILERLQKQEITFNEYFIEYQDVYYKNAKANGISSLIGIVVAILYYIVYQTYMKGQTLGKKFMKIRVVSNDGELTMNQMIFRSFLATNLLLDMIAMCFITFASKDVFFTSSFIFEGIIYTVFIISFFMVAFGKDGRAIHDRLFHTTVERI